MCAQVPYWQSRIVQGCRKRGKPVIVATNMLESMIGNPTPTRAEVRKQPHTASLLNNSSLGPSTICMLMYTGILDSLEMMPLVAVCW